MVEPEYYYGHLVHMVSGRIFKIYSEFKYATDLWEFISKTDICEFIEKAQNGEFLTLVIKANAIIAINNPYGTTDRIDKTLINRKRQNELLQIKEPQQKHVKIRLGKTAKPIK